MWPEAKRAASRSLALDPHGVTALHALLICSINGAGDIGEAKRALAMFPQGTRIINFLSLGVSTTGPYFYVIERDYGGALKACEKEIADPDENRSRLVARVAIHVLAGDTDRAHDEIEQVRVLLERRLNDRPNDAFAMMQMSWVNVALDRKADALRLTTASDGLESD